ncbi:hypothetical protein SM87_02748 [Klebsiella pneumoniae]|nr:hypothetical protein SM87_02748 [Klebsiella pneumoniae]
MPVTAGRALALATVPTMMFCLSPLNRALADDYFDPAALEFADPQQQTSDCTTSPNPAGSSRALTLSPWWLTIRSWVRLILRLLTMAGSCSRC